MPKQLADEMVSVRLPKGLKQQIKAATGQPLSRLVRILLLAYRDKMVAEGRFDQPALAQNFTDAADVVSNLEEDEDAE